MKKYKEFNVNLELNADNEAPILEGYFIRYNSPSPAGGGFYEQIAPNALKDLSGDIRCLYNHNNDVVLGRVSAETLEIENRADGLFGRVKVNMEDSQARDIYARVKRGDISGCSFGAFIRDETVEDTLITINDIELIEVSICPFPFYKDTTIDARNDNKFEFLKRRLKRKWQLKA